MNEAPYLPPVVVECQILRTALQEIASGSQDSTWCAKHALEALMATHAVSTEALVQERSTPVEPAGDGTGRSW